MSLEQEILRAKLAKLPLPSPCEIEENDEEMDIIMPLGSPNITSKRKGKNSTSTSPPLSWNDYYDSEIDITIEDDIFHIYKIGNIESNNPSFIMVHGAGYSGLSFGLISKYLYENFKFKCQIISYDSRGHGKTKCLNELDMSIERLSRDLISIIENLFKNISNSEIFLVGHSMGGAIVSHVGSLNILPILGVAVLDIVEGSAMDALGNMERILSIQPREFPSIEKAIDWHVRSGTIRNRMSARLSVPSLFRKVEQDEKSKYIWRANLSLTKPFWKGWFEGLSKKFLSIKGGRLLILAGTDRLDKEMTIAQMQGKYQLVVIPDVGHCLQEDAPEKTAQILFEFYKRNDRNVVIKRMVPKK